MTTRETDRILDCIVQHGIIERAARSANRSFTGLVPNKIFLDKGIQPWLDLLPRNHD
jgi:hypothetical protein